MAPESPATLDVKELLLEREGYGVFYRIIRYHNTIVIRDGAVGTEGDLSVLQPHHLVAEANFEALVTNKVDVQGYQAIVKDSWSPFFSAPPTAYEIEQEVFRMWRCRAPISSSPDPLRLVEWGIVKDLLASSRVSTFFRCMLEEVANVPHAIDENRDLCLLPLLQGDYALSQLFPKTQGTSATVLDWLGPVKKEHASDVMRSVLSLYYEGHPNPRDLFAASELLVTSM